MATLTPSGWEGLLDEGETILWQGRPASGLSFHGIDLKKALKGLFFMGFSIFWMWRASNTSGSIDGIGSLFPLFGLPFFFVGFHNAIGHLFWQAYLRSKTHYTLSSKRAFIALDHPTQGRTLKDYPIDANTDITLKMGPPDSIWFTSKRIGFAHIDDGRAVLSLIRQIQKDTA